jgi:oleandomycin transport system ATP-binding protein
VTAAVEVRGLVKRFSTTRALDGLSLQVSEGSMVGLLGPNGAGKTTAVRVLATLILPDGGSATVGGYDVVRQPAQVRALIGLTGQYAAVDELLSGPRNVYLIGRLGGLSRRAARARRDELLDTFGLVDAAGRPVKTYSGGMRRRLDLAASLVTDPRVLILDGPTTGLDPRSRSLLWGLIRARVAAGTAVLLTTQYLDEADHLCDHIVVIDHGQTAAAGSPTELKQRLGGQRLVVQPVNGDDLAAAGRVLSDLTGAQASIDAEAQEVSLPIPDPAIVLAALHRLDAERLEIGRFTVRSPSLDEVFLTLTAPDASPAATTHQPGGAR